MSSAAGAETSAAGAAGATSAEGAITGSYDANGSAI